MAARLLVVSASSCRSFSGVTVRSRAFSYTRWWQEIPRYFQQQSGPARRSLYTVSSLIASLPTVFKLKGRDAIRPSNPILSPSVPVETTRVMLPDDTNPMGNVHGGTILKLIEEAGHIVATRHCNKDRESGESFTAVLARVEHMDFHNPMYVGEVAKVQAMVTFTSRHSMEVTVDVWAENTLTGTNRHTNSARLWYVAVSSDVGPYESKFQTVPVPQLEGLSETEAEAGRLRYEAQKNDRVKPEKEQTLQEVITYSSNEPPCTVANSRAILSNVVLPSDCTVTGHMMGGALMKLMDTAAGISSVKHCRTLAVTACLDAINFHGPIFNGDLLFVSSQVVFTSAKSVVVGVRVEAEGLRSGSRRVTNDALFTFVSLGKMGKAIAVPPLVLRSEEEREKFEEMREMYEKRKRERQRSS